VKDLLLSLPIVDKARLNLDSGSVAGMTNSVLPRSE